MIIYILSWYVAGLFILGFWLAYAFSVGYSSLPVVALDAIKIISGVPKSRRTFVLMLTFVVSVTIWPYFIWYQHKR